MTTPIPTPTEAWAAEDEADWLCEELPRGEYPVHPCGYRLITHSVDGYDRRLRDVERSAATSPPADLVRARAPVSLEALMRQTDGHATWIGWAPQPADAAGEG